MRPGIWIALVLCIAGMLVFFITATKTMPNKTAAAGAQSTLETSPPASSVPQTESSASTSHERVPAQETVRAFVEQTWAEAANVLTLINVGRDTVSGSWRIENGALCSDAGEPARLEFPYFPPAEYDFRMEFTQPVAGNVGQVLYTNGHQFGWYMGAYVNSRAGFQMIDGKAMPENPTGVKAGLLANHRYTSLVEVRKSGVKAYLDGKLISQWATDYHDMSLFPDSRLRGTDVLGVWTAAAATTFHSLQVREVSGRGGSTLHGQKPPGDF